MTGKARVFIFDDDADSLQSVAAALRRDGFEVHPFADPKEGLSRLAAEGGDVVVTDLRMPGLTGLEVLRHVTRDHPGAAPGFIHDRARGVLHPVVLQQGLIGLELILGEPAAHPTGVDQARLRRSAAGFLGGAGVGGKMQGPEARARALGRGHPDDHEVRDPVGLELQPVAAPPRPILRIRPLGHDPFETHAFDFAVEERAFSDDVIDEAQRPRFRKHVAQDAPALEQGQRPKVEILEREYVEDLEGGGRTHRGHRHVRGAPQLRTLLESRETGSRVVVETDQFPVQDQPGEGKERSGPGNFGIQIGGPAAPPRRQ